MRKILDVGIETNAEHWLSVNPGDTGNMMSIPNIPFPTLCEFLRNIALGPEGAKRLPGLDLELVKSLATRIAQADPDPRRPYIVLVRGVPEDFDRVIATLISGRPLMVLDIARDEDLIRQACVAANALPIDNLPSIKTEVTRLIAQPLALPVVGNSGEEANPG